MFGGGGVEHFGCHPITWLPWLPAVVDDSGQQNGAENGGLVSRATMLRHLLSGLRSSLAAEIQPCEHANCL